MSHRFLLALPLLLTACPPDADDVPVDTNDPADQAPACPEFEFTGTLSAAADQTPPDADVLIALNPIDLSQGDFVLDDPTWQGKTDARLTAGGATSFTVCLPAEPPEGAHTANGDMEIAMYLVGAYVDDNENEKPGKSDTYLGASFVYLAHVKGTPSEELASSGGSVGWNLLDFNFQNASYAATPVEKVTDYALESNLLPPVLGPLAGVITAELAGDVDVAITHVDPILGLPSPDEPTLVTVTVPGSGTSTPYSIDDIPVGNDTHFSPRLDTTLLTDVEAALYIGIAYTDTNENGTWDQGVDASVANSASGTDASFLGYFHPTGFRSIIYLDEYDIGWFLLGLDGSLLDWSDGMNLNP